MTRIPNLTTFALSLLCLVVRTTPCSGDIFTVKRYYHSGDGRIHIVNAKNGVSFKGRYRTSDGAYDEKALKVIYGAFDAEYGKPLSTISLRLIEFLDYLEDRLRPGSRITILSGWRSPEYNSKLRSRGKLAAKASLHQYGMAADIKMDGVPSERIWNYVKQLGFGGAGYYHGELVHIDVGPARSWDEKTSGVGTDISEDNKLIGLVTDFDMYRPGDRLTLRFIRMTAFPIGVTPQFTLDRVEEDGKLRKSTIFEPSFAVDVDGSCPKFFHIGEMLGIRYQLPIDIQPSRYMIRASFCDKPWQDMPAEISTPEFEVVRE